MPTDWSQLTHAYGPATDVPRLFEQTADPELAADAWFATPSKPTPDNSTRPSY